MEKKIIIECVRIEIMHTISSVGKLKGNEKLAKAIIDNDIIAAGLAIKSQDDRYYALKHLDVSHEKIIALAHQSHTNYLKATKAMNNMGYIYRYVYDRESSNPINKNDYGPLITLTKEVVYMNMYCKRNIVVELIHACLMRAKAELTSILEHYISSRDDNLYPILDYMVVNDSLIRDIVGTETLTHFWTEILSDMDKFYNWVNICNADISVIDQYIKVPLRLEVFEPVNLNKEYIEHDLNDTKMFVAPDGRMAFYSSQQSNPKDQIQNRTTMSNLYLQMPQSFKRASLTLSQTSTALYIIYYNRYVRCISNFIKRHNINMMAVDDSIESSSSTSTEQMGFVGDDQELDIEEEISHIPLYTVGCFKLIRITMGEDRYILIGGKLFHHNKDDLYRVNLRNTIYRVDIDVTFNLKELRYTGPTPKITILNDDI